MCSIWAASLVELGGIGEFRAWAGETLHDEEIWRRWLSSPSVRAFESGQVEAAQFAAAVVDEMQLSVSPSQFLAAFTRWPKGLYPGVESLLMSLRSRYTLASLSNTNALHWPRFEAEMGLLPLFTHHFPSHLTGRLKPDVTAFEAIAPGAWV